MTETPAPPALGLTTETAEALRRDARRDEAHRRRRLEQILLEDHRTVTLGMRVTALDDERIVLEQTIGPTDVNGLNLCHGGVIFTLADSATGVGANTLDDESAWVTVTSEIHFRQPARIGDRLTATCRLAEALSARRRRFETVVHNIGPEGPVAAAGENGAEEVAVTGIGAGGAPPVVAVVDSLMVRLRPPAETN
ncbi:PaaI family thioesterase [Pseudoclavibacter endophyticus]|uniref:PaaI family thioesterase n=1 Tax=Pseudoclavibacter endophyticus TaxID=1778590 RepID=UPI0016647188|nr:hotdog fold thioesterase [Pseudoclavibacter endophyticus]